MSRTPETVLAELLALSPPGDALPLDGSGVWPQMLWPLANEISRFEGLAEEMLAEVNPGEAQYLLADYERVLGPDPYGRDATALTLADQQALTLSRWTSRYGVRPADFVALAASFGEAITITDDFPLTTAGCFADVCLVDGPTRFVWIVNMPAAVIEYAYASQASAGDLLGSFSPSLVQPVIAGRAPAHTTPVFNYA
jgi:uncharacterized protein YmfQ (DUF2313 family)